MNTITDIARCVRRLFQGGPSGLPLPAGPALALSGAAAVLLSALGYAFYKWHRLSHVPGPFWTPYSLFRLLAWGKLYEEFPALSEKYGPIVRIGPNMVMYSDSETLSRVTAVRSPYTKGSFYTSVRIPPVTDNVFSTTGVGEHRALRAKIAGGYSGREHGGFEPAINNNIASLIALIESKYVSAPGACRPFDMAKRAQFFALDVLGEVSQGRPFGFLQKDEDLYSFLEFTDRYWGLLALVVCLPGLTGLFSAWPLRGLMPKVGDEKGSGALFGRANEVVERRFGGGEKGSDMVQSFVDAGMSQFEVEQEMYVEIMAGHDTVATAIRMTLLCLLTTPASYARLQAELDAAVAAGAVSSPIRDAEARALPYLQAVVREALRRYPPATGFMTKVVPAGGDTVGGYYLPAGTELAANICGVTHQGEVFGGDAGVFRPERWLEAGEGEARRMAGVVEMVFGGGRNTCPGRVIALMEINKFIPELLRRYDLSIVRSERPVDLFHGIFWLTNDFDVRITRREGVVV